ncbi:uncharacterized protein [Pyrus communis]|uniref:uncharacterized protein n=1 Tax=Pyrus communis TaxID=23211 RepID=UPI0035BF69BB
MECDHPSTGKHNKLEDGEVVAANQLEGEVKLADLIWVKISGGSWWPAQVVDDNNVSNKNKPSKRSAEKVLVRLYGSYKYRHAPYLIILTELLNFQILKQNNGCYREILLKALEQVSSPKSDISKKQGSKSKENVAVDLSRRKSSHNHARENPQTDSSNLNAVAQRTEFSVRVSPRKRNVVIPQSKVEQKTQLALRVGNANGKASKQSGAEVVSKEVSARRLRVMQQLGLIAPSGSSFHNNGLI